MALTCIADAFNSISATYNRFLSAESLNNVHVKDLVSDDMVEASFLALVVKITHSCSLATENVEYCDYLEDSLNIQ